MKLTKDDVICYFLMGGLAVGGYQLWVHCGSSRPWLLSFLFWVFCGVAFDYVAEHYLHKKQILAQLLDFQYDGNMLKYEIVEKNIEAILPKSIIIVAGFAVLFGWSFFLYFLIERLTGNNEFNLIRGGFIIIVAIGIWVVLDSPRSCRETFVSTVRRSVQALQSEVIDAGQLRSLDNEIINLYKELEVEEHDSYFDKVTVFLLNNKTCVLENKNAFATEIRNLSSAASDTLANLKAAQALAQSVSQELDRALNNVIKLKSASLRHKVDEVVECFRSQSLKTLLSQRNWQLYSSHLNFLIEELEDVSSQQESPDNSPTKANPKMTKDEARKLLVLNEGWTHEELEKNWRIASKRFAVDSNVGECETICAMLSEYQKNINIAHDILKGKRKAED